MDPLNILVVLVAIPIAMLGIAALQGEGESVRECLRWLYNKIRR
jgi:hypothetical protein